jgi:hypothetical protein
MRKRMIDSNETSLRSAPIAWLRLEEIATVELTSEDPDHLIESALQPHRGSGWRAALRGPQVIRIRFDEPQSVRRIELEFNEAATQRTQEYVLRWSNDLGKSFREIVRQQFNFSSPDATREVEFHDVELRDVTSLELRVTPDIERGQALASLTQLRLG